MGGAGDADGRRQVVDQRVGAEAELLRGRGDGPRVRAGDDGAVDVARRQLGRLERGAEGLLGQRHVAGLAELLLPQAGAVLARHPPAVGELVGGRAHADELGDDGAVGVGADEDRRAAVAALALLAGGGQAGAQVGGDRQRRAVGGRARPAARRRPSAPSRRGRRPGGRSRCAAPRGWRWRWSCRGRRARWWRTTPRAGCPVAPTAAPGARPRRPTWWCPGRTRPPTACPCRRRTRRSGRWPNAGGGGTGRSRPR